MSLRKMTLLALAATFALAWLPHAHPAMAQEEMSQEEIEAALKPKKITRSLKPSPATKGKAEFDDMLSRSIGVKERKKIADYTKDADLPRLDFSIRFAFDSAEIDQRSYRVLDRLAAALESGGLNRSRFLVNGHTDTKGSDEYNLALSQRRADAVVQYLVSQHGIKRGRLLAIGFGETALKNPYDGEAAANRRVEIINRP